MVVELAAFILYATSTPYMQSRLKRFEYVISGWSDNLFSQMKSYLYLRRDNIALTERIAELESRINAYQTQMPEGVEVELDLRDNEYITGKVVSNSLNLPQNYIVINKGVNDNVRIGMSVLSPEGYAVGYVTNCSEDFSIALSILNTSFNVSSRLSKDRSIGLVSWNGVDHQLVQFTDVSKYANIAIGDSVEALDFSDYFPSGTIIGIVESMELNDDQTMYSCQLRLAADIARIDNVILVDCRHIDQVRRLKSEPTPEYLNVEDMEETTNN